MDYGFGVVRLGFCFGWMRWWVGVVTWLDLGCDF